MPPMVRISDVLPAPLAPTMATIAPCATSSDTLVERLRVAIKHIEGFDGQHQPTASVPR